MCQEKVDVLAISRQLGVTIKFADVEDFDGRIQWDPEDRATITLATRGGHYRQRFTLAHELGHLLLRKEFLDDGAPETFRGVSTNRRDVMDEERWANLLAAEILMPHTAIRRRLQNESVTLTMVAALGKQFGASKMAVLRRLADVSGQLIFFLNIVPTLFSDQSTPAEVDDAVFVTPRRGTLISREGTYLVGRPKFAELVRSDIAECRIHCPVGTFKLNCDVVGYATPFPNADLFSVAPEPMSRSASVSFVPDGDGMESAADRI